MKPITEISTPRKDFRNGELTDQHFAAQLGAVVRNPGACPVCDDPDAFFELTYPTAELKEDLRRDFDNPTLETPDMDEGLWRFDRGDTPQRLAYALNDLLPDSESNLVGSWKVEGDRGTALLTLDPSRASDTEATLAVWGHPLVDGLWRTRAKADSGHAEQVQP